MKLACLASSTAAAREARASLGSLYTFVDPAQADAIVVVGGDGFLLHCLHEHHESGVPLYGMNRGSIGFLMNEYREDRLEERVRDAQEEVLHPLRMKAHRPGGSVEEALAFNEVSLLRHTRMTANLRVLVNGVVRIENLVADGILVATPAGSTAYNLSAHGPIVPLGANLLAMTPISPFRPRRWQGALLQHTAEVRIENIDPVARPVSVAADFDEISGVDIVEILEDRTHAVTLLFDPDRSLEERIFSEQFAF